MFTGIIEEIGKIKEFTKTSNGAKVVISCQKVLDGTTNGDSIAVNGVCETVTSAGSDWFCADISDETLSVTTFGNLKKGDKVNLERALTLNSRLGGHIVQGHVDCRGKFLGKEQLTDFYNLKFEIPDEQKKYLVYKGAVTVNGISLTTADVSGNIFTTAIIPHTYNNTNLSELKTGDLVNIETDILGKYIEKLLTKEDNTGISMNFLQENGFV